MENNDDGYDAIYHCDDIDVVNIDVQDDCQSNCLLFSCFFEEMTFQLNIC